MSNSLQGFDIVVGWLLWCRSHVLSISANIAFASEIVIVAFMTSFGTIGVQISRPSLVPASILLTQLYQRIFSCHVNPFHHQLVFFSECCGNFLLNASILFDLFD
jgi:hypothetical protein